MAFFIIVEQHIDGAWWFHPATGYYASREEAEEGFLKWFWYDKKRTHQILGIQEKFPEGHISWYSTDLVNFAQNQSYKTYVVKRLQQT